MRKKMLFVLMTCLMLLSGCGQSPIPAETTITDNPVTENKEKRSQAYSYDATEKDNSNAFNAPENKEHTTDMKELHDLLIKISQQTEEHMTEDQKGE